MGITLGRFFNDTSAGWTSITPSADSLIIYCNDNTGSDGTAVDGDINHPYKTLDAAFSRVRSGMPDWILLDRDSTWTDQYFNIPSMNSTQLGRGPTEPFVLWSYGSGTRRPLIKSASSQSLLELSGNGTQTYYHYMALMGFEAKCYTRDPADGGYNSSSTGQLFGISNRMPTKFMLIEDVKVHFYTTNVALDFTNQLSKPGENVYVRRCVIVDAYSPGGGTVTHAQGLHVTNVAAWNFTAEENLIDANGYNATRGGTAGPDKFNHDMYFDDELAVTPVTVRGNILSRAAANGTQMRGGGLMQYNVFEGNPIVGFVAGTNGSSMLDNVALGGISVSSTYDGLGIANAWGFTVNSGTDNCIVSRNIAAHAVPSDADFAFRYDGNNTSGSGNIAYQWGTIGVVDNGTGNSVGVTVDGSGYLDATRTVGSYNSSVRGGTGTTAAFMTAARDQRKDSYDLSLTTRPLLNNIRAGFNLTAVSADDAGGNVTTRYVREVRSA